MSFDEFGGSTSRSRTALVSLSILAALACGGVGCSSGNVATSQVTDGGDGGDGAQTGDGSEGADGESADAPEDAAADSPNTQDAPSESSTTDAPSDGPGEASEAGGGADAGDAATDASDATVGPSAVFSASLFDEGPANCGSAAGVTSNFSIQNSGTAALTVSASIGGTVFSVSPSMLTIGAGTSGSLAVTAVVPSSAQAGAAISGTMMLSTNDPSHATATIPLSVTPTGATLAWASSSPTSANFGVQQESQPSTPITLTLANTGNASASVAFGAPSDTQFSLSPTSASIAAAGTATLTAGFTPNTLTTTNASSTFTVTGTVCGTSLTSLAFSGQGGVGVVNGWPTATVDFGPAPCGGAAPANQTFQLTNSGGVAAHITGAAFSGTTYQSSAGVGAAIPAGGSLTVTLTAPAVPAVSAVPGNYAGQITYTTDVVGDTPHTVSVTEEASGAILTYDTSATPNFGNFNTVPAGTVANENFALVNSGNAVSSVTFSTATPFSVTPSGAFNVSGTSSQSATASFAPTTFGPFSSAVHIASATNLCQPAPADLPLTGTGQAGGISLSAQSLAFPVNCGQTAPPQMFTITNTGNTSMTWTAQLPNGTGSDALYTFSPTSATLGSLGVSTIVVTPAAMPPTPASTSPSAFADSITITTNITNDTAHTVSLGETPLGDVLSLEPTSLNFQSIPINTDATQQSFVVVNAANAGSATASVTFMGSDEVDFPMSANAATASPGGQSSPVNVQFDAPGTPASYSSDITFMTSDVLCAPLPPGITASGTATEAGPVISPASLNFQLVNCGSTGAPLQITAGNNGTQSYNITGLTLGKGASSYFTVTMVPTNGEVDPGGTPATITVTPIAIPSTHTPVPDSATFSDVLTITTNANVPNPDTTVPLTMGAQGIIITNNLASTNWSFGTVNFGSTGYYNNLITNTGNESAQVTLGNLNYASIFGLQGQPVTVPNGSVTLTGTFTPPSSSGTWADVGTLSVAAAPGAVFCEPLPSTWQSPSISLSGTAGSNPVITVSPSTLTFPSATCGGTVPSGLNVTLTNNGSSSTSYTAVLGSTGTTTGTYYSVTSATPNPVPANSSAAITVTPTVNLAAGAGATVGSSPYNDDLVITLGGTQYDVAIQMTVNGVVLSLNNALGDNVVGYNGSGCARFTYNYYVEAAGTTVTATYPPVVTNGGTVSGAVSATFSGWSAADFSTTSPITINPNANQTFSLNTTDPGAADLCNGTRGWYSGTVTFSAPNMCNSPVQVPIAGHYQP